MSETTNQQIGKGSKIQCKISCGEKYAVEERFNEWAKSKELSKDVIIHTFAHASGKYAAKGLVLIAIYYPEKNQSDTED